MEVTFEDRCGRTSERHAVARGWQRNSQRNVLDMDADRKLRLCIQLRPLSGRKFTTTAEVISDVLRGSSLVKQAAVSGTKLQDWLG